MKLRHLGKTHKVDVTSLYDAFKSTDLSLQHCPTDMQAADVFTKSLDAPKCNLALSMAGMFPGERQSSQS